ncbi:MAG: PIG-L deacetylase family protein [Acidimicrobiales bacterium]
MKLPRPVVVLSPHLDDAVLSCAHALAACPGSIVVTVFAGAPNVRHRGYNSKTTGHSYAPDALEVRRAEDRAALASLDARPVWIDLLDADYAEHRGGRPYADVVREALAHTLATLAPGTILSPLGLWHDDHVLVATSAIPIALALGVETILYLDLPYGLAMPQLVENRLEALSRGAELHEVAIGEGVVLDKDALMRRYETQYRAARRNARRAFTQTMRGGERYWRLNRQLSNSGGPSATPDPGPVGS